MQQKEIGIDLQTENKMVISVQTRYENWDNDGWLKDSDNTYINGVKFFTEFINLGTNYIKGINNRCFI